MRVTPSEIRKFERLDALLMTSVDRYGEALAALGSGGAISYRELGDRSGAIETDLRAQDLQPGEPVLVSIGNRPADLVAFLGVWRAGGVVVPVHVAAAASSREHAISATGSRFFLREPADGEVTSFAPTTKSGLFRRPDSLAPSGAIDLTGAAFVVFTSGSTGQPKGVVLGHRGYCGKLAAITEVIPFEVGSRTLMPLQLTFSFGQWTSLLTLVSGGSVELMAKFDTAAVIERLLAGADRIPIVPSMLRLLATKGDLAALEDVRTLFIAGGEVLPAALARALRAAMPQACFADVYGLTETNSADFIVTPDRFDAFAGSIGLPSPGVTYRIQPLNGAGASDGGELQIKTPFVMLDYLGHQDLFSATFDGHYLRTGDLALQRSDGTVELCGRIKDEIHRGGNKISPVEVENRYAAHPAIAAAMAVGLDDAIYGQAIHIALVAGVSPVNDEALRDWGRQGLEGYKVPTGFHWIENLPEGSTGKGDRAALKKLIQAVVV